MRLTYAKLREHHENDVRTGLKDATKLFPQKGRINRNELLAVRVFSLGLCAVLLFSVVSMPLGRNLFQQVGSSPLGGLPFEFISPEVLINTSNDKIQSLDVLGRPFITNEGQQDAEVLYYTDIFAGTVYITEDGLTYALRNAASNTIQSRHDSSMAGVAIKESFVGSNPLQPQGQDQTQTRFNYFVGDQSNWKANIPAFNKVSFGQVWNGIDVDLVAADNNVEKIFTVAPGADLKDIQVALEGVIGINVNSQGELVIETELGEVSLTKPVAFQEIGTASDEVEVSYVIDGAKYGFAVGDGYDPSLPLIIDPLLASTYIGGVDDDGNSGQSGSSSDHDVGISFDSSGNVFITGLTRGAADDYPDTEGPYGAPSGALSDVVVSKFNSDLSFLLASAVIGGGATDKALAITIDSDDNIYITGVTNSTDFPTTDGAFSEIYGGLSDIFVSKLSNDLSSLDASTFVGGNDEERATAITIRAAGAVYVVGFSRSPDYPTTLGAYDTTNDLVSGPAAVVTSLDPDLTTISGSTFLGGSNDSVGMGVATSSTGNVYVTGLTLATDFPIVGGYDASKSGANQHDTFVAALDSDLTDLLASTYHGGGTTAGEHTTPFGIALDTADNVYIAGYTHSAGFPITTGATYDAGTDDAYITVLPSSLGSLSASTVIGGTSDERISGLALTDSGVYVSASGGSYPTTPGAFNEGANDAYVSKVSLDLTTLLASTSIGGSSTDILAGIGISSGRVYVAGFTRSTDYPTTPGAYDTDKAGAAGSFDLVVSKFTADLSADTTPITPQPGIIAFYSGSAFSEDIYVMDTNSDNRINVSNDPSSDADPALSPDGTKIAFTSFRDGNYEIYVMDTDGANPINVSDNATTSDYYPNWSPDGTKIAFTRYIATEPIPNEQVWVMDADGDNQMALTPAALEFDESRPAFSPDGNKIAISSTLGGNWDVYTMDSSGDRDSLINLSDNDAFESDAAWSPDGSQIAFTSDRDGNFEVYVMDSDDGGNQANLSENGAWDALPSWSPDGSQIAFHSTRDGTFQIFLMEADGDHPTNISNNEVDDSDPSWSLPASAPSDTSPPNHPPLSDLVSWYRAEGNADDSADNNDGTAVVTYGPGQMGQAFSFNGDGDQMTIDASSNLDVGTSDGFTISAWINPDDLMSRPVVEYNNGDGGDGVHMWASYPDPGQLYANIKDTAGVNHQVFSPVGILTAGAFQQVAVTYDKTSGIAKLYRNGIEVQSQNLGIFTPQTAYDLYIGARPSGIEYAGLIDEVTIHNRALDADEIQAMNDDGNAVSINSGDATTISPTVTLTLVCHDEQSGCERIDVTFANTDANIDDDVKDTITIDVSSESDPGGERDAEETGLDTGIFQLTIFNSSDDIVFGDGEAVTATETFFDAALGTKTIDVVFTDGDDNSVMQSDIIELVAGVQPTSLTLNPLRDVTATTGFTVSGELVNDDTGEGISGQLITFDGSGTNPSLQSVMTEGVTFTGAIDLVSCPTPATPTPTTCTTDDIGTDDTTSDNIVLHLGVGGKIAFPASTVTAKIYLQDMGTSSFKYIVEEAEGPPQPEATSAGSLSPVVAKVEIVSGYSVGGDPNGIKEITITEITGGTSVGIAAVLTGNPDGLPVEQHQINFEEFAPGVQASPFTVNPGFFFSTGFAQNIDEEGLQITAHYGGSGGLGLSDSQIESYNVLANTGGLGGEGSQSLGGATGTSITTLDCNTDVGSVDTDNDGICDIWEQSGVTLGNGFYPLAGVAQVGQRDIFVEIDCMTGFCPTTAGSGINNNIQTIIDVFAAEGFTLHIDVDESNLAVFDPLHVWNDNTPAVLDDFDSIKKAKFGTPGERSSGTLGSGNDFLKAKAQVYHYGLFVKNINTLTNTACGPSGQAELRGNDFIVAVGCTTSGGFTNSHQQRIGTLMHELGHNLGLRHGGGDDDNCKPNLISVMNYARQFPWGSLAATTANGARTEWSPTYSREALDPLNENNLQESAGLTITTSEWNRGSYSSFGPGSSSFEIVWGRPAVTYGATGASVNWNNAAGNTAAININTLTGMTGCTGTLKSTLESYDEWSIMDLNFRDEGNGIDGVVYPDPDTLAELTPEVLEQVKEASIVGPNNVFNNPGISVLPDVAADAENNIYVVWSEKPGLFSGNFEVFFSKSLDGGATFSPPVNISNNAGDSLTPRIAESEGILYVVWSDKTGGTSGKYDIRFSKSSNMGDNWDASVKLSSNSGDSLTPAIAASGSDVYVVWSDKTSGTSNRFDIQFKKSVDGGGSFTPNSASGTKVSSNSGESLTPDVEVSSSGIFVVWSDTSGGTSNRFDILFKKSTDGGTTFLPNTANAKNISTNSGISLTPSLAVDGDSVYVTWSDTTGGTSGNFDILFKKSTDAGDNFDSVVNVSITSSLSATPRIVASSGIVHIAWSDIGTPGQFDIFVKKSLDDGENFDSEVNISDNSGQSITPAIVLTDPVLHLVWGDLTPGITGDIMYASRIV